MKKLKDANINPKVPGYTLVLITTIIVKGNLNLNVYIYKKVKILGGKTLQQIHYNLNAALHAYPIQARKKEK